MPKDFVNILQASLQDSATAADTILKERKTSNRGPSELRGGAVRTRSYVVAFRRNEEGERMLPGNCVRE